MLAQIEWQILDLAVRRVYREHDALPTQDSDRIPKLNQDVRVRGLSFPRATIDDCYVTHDGVRLLNLFEYYGRDVWRTGCISNVAIDHRYDLDAVVGCDPLGGRRECILDEAAVRLTRKIRLP